MFDANGRQAASTGVAIRSCASRDVPPLDIVLINRPDIAPLGAGEPATIPVAASIGNAIFDATGVRLYEGPFTAEARARGVTESSLMLKCL